MSYNNGEKPLNVTVKIESIEDKERSIKIKADKSYSFFKFKQDGSKTSMYEQFVSMEIKSGSVVNISYVPESFTTRDGKQATANKVIWFREANGIPVQAEKPHQGAVNAPQSKPEIDWDKLGYKKTLTNWTSELLGQGSPVEEIKKFLQGEAWELWKAIDVEGERRFNPARVAFEQKTKEQAEIQKQIENVPPENVPLPEDPGEVDVDSIPF